MAADKAVSIARQSAVVPVLRHGNKLRVVLITSSAGHWIVPKGKVKTRLGKADSAKAEAHEEGGLTGRVYRKRITTINPKADILIDVYLLDVHKAAKDWDEVDKRERTIVTPDQALRLVHKPYRSAIRAAVKAAQQLD